ncbi:MAG: hypothetical protein STSR0009_07200 [Methanoregula sp.]
MTTPTKRIQVRMPQHLVQELDQLTADGVYSSRSEAVIDSVRRLVLAYEGDDPFKKVILNSYLSKPVQGSIDDLRGILDPQDIMNGIRDAFDTDSIDQIITEVRR